MKDALAIHRWLLAHQIHHEIVRLPRPLTCADELPEVLGAPASHCVRVTVFQAVTRGSAAPVAVVGAAGTAPAPSAVAAVLGADRVSAASAFVVNSVTDYADGLVCPLLLPDGLTVLVDRRLADGIHPDEFVHTVTGERRTALRIRARHLFSLVTGTPADLAVPRPRVLTPLASPMRTA
ncbi:aminoacyl-tRNA deacylase [Microtetraspora niveoalba]|uniref:aminoacyl-tRNA deacylase n=1 Tax=Microtetraspora niveoalba TaxID=46175 RepID=UPI000835E2B1|nr:YbaK/EbsC family protein [Microtetraspora niveoalba]